MIVEQDSILDATDLAEALHVSVDTANKYMREGTVPSAKIGQKHYYTTGALLHMAIEKEALKCQSTKPSFQET